MRSFKVHDANDAEAWDAVICRSADSDFYHTLWYHREAEAHGEGKAHLLVFVTKGQMVALPLLVRQISKVQDLSVEGRGRSDATSVYGYAGPVVSPRVPGVEALVGFREELISWARSVGLVAAFTRLHPLFNQQPIFEGLGEVQPAGSTVSIDLKLSPNEQFQRYHSTHRYDIRRLRKQGYVCVEDTEHRFLSQWAKTYHDNMKRLQAEDYYFFSQNYIGDLLAHSNGCMRLFVVIKEGELAAGGLFSFHRGIVQYHLSATTERFLKLSPTKLLLDHVRIVAGREGATTFHLGGGLRGCRDSLFNFKSRFSDRSHEFRVWKWIVDFPMYEALYKRRLALSLTNGTLAEKTNHFPAYRTT